MSNEITTDDVLDLIRTTVGFFELKGSYFSVHRLDGYFKVVGAYIDFHSQFDYYLPTLFRCMRRKDPKATYSYIKKKYLEALIKTNTDITKAIERLK